MFVMPFFLPLFISAPLATLPLLFLAFFSWYTSSDLAFLFILCFLFCFPHLFPPSLFCTPFTLLSPPYSAAHYPQVAEEAASSSPCPESTCGSENSFSPPFCARTSVSSRRPRQVGPRVQVWGSPAPTHSLSLHMHLSLQVREAAQRRGLCQRGRSGGNF